MRTGLLLKPEVILAALLFVLGAGYLMGGLLEGGAELRVVELQAPEGRSMRAVEVQLVRFDPAGLEVPSFVTVEVPEDDEAGLYAATLAALRETLVADGVWPQELPAPVVFLPSVGRSSNLVLDFRFADKPSLTVAQERSLLDSIEATLAANGIDSASYLQNGQAARVFLEHLTVRSSL